MNGDGYRVSRRNESRWLGKKGIWGTKFIYVWALSELTNEEGTPSLASAAAAAKSTPLANTSLVPGSRPAPSTAPDRINTDRRICNTRAKKGRRLQLRGQRLQRASTPRTGALPTELSSSPDVPAPANGEGAALLRTPLSASLPRKSSSSLLFWMLHARPFAPQHLAVSEPSAEQHETITRRGIRITNLSIGGARVP